MSWSSKLKKSNKKNSIKEEQSRLRKAESYSHNGFNLNKDGLFEAAIKQFNKALEFNPHGEKALNGKGFSLFNLGVNLGKHKCVLSNKKMN